MKNKILGILLTSSLLLTACGGSDNKTNDNQYGKDPNGNGGEPANKPLTIALTNTISGIALREALLSGLVDTLISGTDLALDNVSCINGTVKITGNVLQFDQCTGLYETDANAKVSGKIDVSNNSYSYEDFTLSFPNGTTQKINGTLKLSINDPVRSVESTKIVLDMQIFNSAKKLIPVNYSFSDYKLIWTSSDATHVQLRISAKLKSTGNEGGDFNIAFDNFMTPFELQKNSDDDLVGYPYSGTLTISDLNQSKNKITIQAIGVNQSAQYVSLGDQDFNKQVPWRELLEY